VSRVEAQIGVERASAGIFPPASVGDVIDTTCNERSVTLNAFATGSDAVLFSTKSTNYRVQRLETGS
jgi:hypothetical protein